MKNLARCVVLLLVASCLPSCATSHAVRWATGEPSAFEEHPSDSATGHVLRPALGIPVIVTSALFDALTWPEQLIFGVWPMWGENSKHFKPNDD